LLKRLQEGLEKSGYLHQFFTAVKPAGLVREAETLDLRARARFLVN
jgi:hypothetical protein